MTIYTVTVGTIGYGIYGYTYGSFGSVSPDDGVIQSLYYSSTGSSVYIIANQAPGTSVSFNGQLYVLLDYYGSGYGYYDGPGLGGPYPTSGTISITMPASSGVSLAADAGSFALTGPGANFAASRRLDAASGAYALDGQPATLAKISFGSMVANAGSFSLTGGDAGLATGQRVAADAAGYTLTGPATGVLASRVLVCAAGSFAAAVQDAGMAATRRLDVAAGGFSLAGLAAGLSNGLSISAGAGFFSIIGGRVKGFDFMTPKSRAVVAQGDLRGIVVPAEDRAITISAQQRSQDVQRCRRTV